MNINDQLATAHSTNLAMVKIEEMEDYDMVLTLIGNAEDIVKRAKERSEELLNEATLLQWGQGFTVSTRNGARYKAEWLQHQHERKDKPCDTCDELVSGNDPRLRVHGGPNGRVTTKSKKVKNEYNCEECAWLIYGAVMPTGKAQNEDPL